jgi:septal ring factor EnvC (AmiA/AmiB activator)
VLAFNRFFGFPNGDASFHSFPDGAREAFVTAASLFVRLVPLFRPGLLVLFVLSGILPGAPCRAESAPSGREIVDRKADLEALRNRLNALKQELSANEESKSDALDQLRQSEEEISRLERSLFALRKEKNVLQKNLDELNQQAKTLENTLAEQRVRLEKLLYRQYARNSPDDPLLFVLNGEDPSALARDLHYLAMVARARNALLADMRAALERQRQLAFQAQARTQALADVETRQESERQSLLRQKKARRTTLDQIAGRIKAQKREIGSLEQNERRLSTLVARLTRLLEKPRDPARIVQPGKSPSEPPQIDPPGKLPSAGPSEGPSVELENRFQPSATSGGFARQKGRLRLPALGRIVGRFGEKRAEDNASWKGLYIRAPEGSEVRAVANGQVVYAEWMRGFGNLLIIDHGSGYLTVYGNNHALLKEVGEQVLGGEIVGTVGSSGGKQDSGLYFELRHQGRVLDPMKWISLK